VNLRGEVPAFPAVRAGNRDLVDLLLREWPGAAKHVLRNVTDDDGVDEWGWDMLELLLRGAADMLLPLDEQPPEDRYQGNDDDLPDGYDAIVASVPPRPPSAEASPDKSSPRIMSSPVSSDETDSSSSSDRHSNNSSPMLHHHHHHHHQISSSASRKRPHVVLSEGQISFDPVLWDEQESALTFSLARSETAVGGSASPRSGRRLFLPLHAALGCGASLPAVLAVLRERPDEDLGATDDGGRTPLHWAVCHARIRGEACATADETAAAAASPAGPPKKKKKKKSKASKTAAPGSGLLAEDAAREQELELVRRLATPEAARVRDRRGHLPLHVALRNRAGWAVVSSLLEAHPRSGVLPCRPPWRRAEAAESDDEGDVGSAGNAGAAAIPRLRPVHLACQHGCELSVVYALLRADPGALGGSCGGGRI
jgi:hypothetical protein